MAGLENENDVTQATVERSLDGDATLLKIAGELDLATVGRVEQELDPLMQSPPDRIVFDLAGVSFMDSSGIALLLRIAEKVESVAVRDPSDSVKMVIRATGLADILRIET
jgi:anti-sigma B factor antagonist